MREKKNRTVYLARVAFMCKDGSMPYMQTLTIRYSYVDRIDAWTLYINEENYKGYLEGVDDACFEGWGKEINQDEGNAIIRGLLNSGWHIVQSGDYGDWNNVACLYAQRAENAEILLNNMLSKLRN
jgi:hypothetical protein|nr:MAG TPA: hypothetical protein [Caudoviricetes sp.]